MKKFLFHSCGIRLFGSTVAAIFTIAMMNNYWLALGTAAAYYIGLGFFPAKPNSNPCVCD